MCSYLLPHESQQILVLLRGELSKTGTSVRDATFYADLVDLSENTFSLKCLLPFNIHLSCGIHILYIKACFNVWYLMCCRCFHVLIYTVARVAFAKQGYYSHALNLSTVAMCLSPSLHVTCMCTKHNIRAVSSFGGRMPPILPAFIFCMSLPLCVWLCTNKSLMRTCCKLISNQVTKQVFWTSIIRTCVTFIKADHTSCTLFTSSRKSVCDSCPSTAHPMWHRWKMTYSRDLLWITGLERGRENIQWEWRQKNSF